MLTTNSRRLIVDVIVSVILIVMFRVSIVMCGTKKLFAIDVIEVVFVFVSHALLTPGTSFALKPLAYSSFVFLEDFSFCETLDDDDWFFNDFSCFFVGVSAYCFDAGVSTVSV